jgi:hypothetical protein
MEIPKIELNAKDILTYEEEEENEDENQDKVNDGNKEEYEEEYEDEEEFDLLNDMLLNDDVSNHIDKFRKIRFFPEEMLNYNHPWRKKKSFSDPYLRKFIPFTSRAKFRHDKQVSTNPIVVVISSGFLTGPEALHRGHAEKGIEWDTELP